ncbi:MAG: SDR family oxidoreductase [Deltaproteobacteria bacterium]|nr:SDR family oxidoreductase [Deltaproteobacteria bacterium]
MTRRALVLGGSGHVGAAAVRALVARGLPVDFTWCEGEARARALSEATGAVGRRLDLTDRAALQGFLRAVVDEGAPDVVLHCAAVSQARGLQDLTDDDWDRAVEVNGRSAFALCRALGPAMGARGGGDIVLVGALDRGQTLPLPVHFAATQGMLSAMTMALGKALGPVGVRVNMVALGPLGEGLSRALPASLVEDYRAFSALRRLGTAEEVARVLAWLALENTFMTGRVVTANGGI